MSPESFEENFETPKPGLKDLIKIDGRWAQYVGHNLVKFLDTDQIEGRDLERYQLANPIRRSLLNVIDYGGEAPSKEEQENIENGGTKRDYLTVFGEYEKLSEQ